MHRHIYIFLLHLERTFVDRGRIFVWTLVAIIPPFIIYMYWRAALSTHKGTIGAWNLSGISSYYFLLIVGSSILLAHIEDSVAREDIQEGQLTMYLLKPFSYYFSKLYMETPYRIIQGVFSLIAIAVFIFLFKLSLTFSTNPYVIFLAIIISLLGFTLCFTFKMIIGIIALWLTDIGGFYQLMDGIFFIFGGLLMPLSLFPGGLASIAYSLPFSYMLYFPIVAFQGNQSISDLHRIIFTQLIWIAIFFSVYIFLFAKGLRKFTGVGQ